MKGMLSLVLWSCLLALPARAGHVTVTFDFSGSSVSLLGGLLQIPPDGSIGPASGQLVVNALGSATPLAGPAQIQNFNLAGSVNAVAFGNTITGNLALNQIGAPVPGSLTPGLAQVVFGAPMQISRAGGINCVGPTCGILSLPVALTGTQLLNLAAMPIANLGLVGGAFVNGSFAITLAGLTGTLQLVGSEVSRVYVPEPHSAGLLLLGLVGLAGWRARRALR
jgi:hypothetical protein